jgi:SNF2 family DNA or RNA helicase
LSWLYQVESSKEARVLDFKCPESESHDQFDRANIPPWILFDTENDETSIYYSLPERVFFQSSPLKPRKDTFIKYRIPVNGVALCDEPGSGKTIVSLALIHSKPFVSLEGLRVDLTSFLPSRATLIVCPLHLASQWQSEALRCMPNAEIVLIQA